MGKKADLVKKVVRNHEFWARVDSISTGVALTAEGVVFAVYGLPALPLLLGAAGALGVAALLGCGAWSLTTGIKNTVRFLKGAYAEVYDKPPPAPPKKKPTLVQRLARHPRLSPAVQKLKKLPLMQKFLDSPVGRLRGGLSEAQHDAFTVGLNVKGSIFVGGAAAVLLAKHLLALPALTVGAVATFGTAVACFYIGKSAFDIFCNTKLLVGNIRKRRAERKQARAAKPAPKNAPAPAPQPAPAHAPSPGPAFAAANAPVNSSPLPTFSAAKPLRPALYLPPLPRS